MVRLQQTAAVLMASLSLFVAQRAEALVYCVTNAVDVHLTAPTGTLANSGWGQTVPITNFLGTIIYTNALLTAKHIVEISLGQTFPYEGTNHTLTARAEDSGSDLVILFFEPAVTNFARINIETNDIHAFAVLQGRGMERGDVVVTEGHTNGWQWAWDKWWGLRRWGVNQYIGETNSGLCAVAAFDNNGDPDECMLSVGDSGGPGFIRTGSGWKLATVNYSVDPALFTAATNPPSAFNASLYDYAGLYYDDGAWRYKPTEASPSPCLLINTRTSKRISWITNTVAGITFPADLGVAWRAETNAPSGSQAAGGLWFEIVVTNAGPYTARNVELDVAWARGVRPLASSASQGLFVTNRWSLPALEDGGAATLRVDTVVWRSMAGWGTNRVSVSSSDKPDNVASNNSASCAVLLPATATLLLICN